MNEKLAFLLIDLQGITFQAIGDVTEIGLPVPPVSRCARQLTFLIIAETQVGFIIGVQEIGIKLFLNYLIGNNQFCFSSNIPSMVSMPK